MSAVFTRLATLADAEQAVAVLRRSITELCELDHQNDPATLERWLRNKTPEVFATWLADNEHRVLVAELDFAVAGVAALHRSGEVRLCYVRPDLVRSGVGRALVSALEDHARRSGVARLTLNSSLTARPFYERCGYVASADSTTLFGVLRGYPYEKRLAILGT